MVEASQEWIKKMAKTPANAKEEGKTLIAKFKTDFYQEFQKDVPSAPKGQCGIQGGGKKCPKQGHCCSGGECGDSAAHCGYSYGKYCQTGFGTLPCFPQTVKAGQKCGRDNKGISCVKGLCCSMAGSCIKKFAKNNPNVNFGTCPSA